MFTSSLDALLLGTLFEIISRLIKLNAYLPCVLKYYTITLMAKRIGYLT